MSYDIALIKERLDIETVLERYTTRPRGNGNWCCPLPGHGDKSPSFSVKRYANGQRWRCFGRCGESGDVLTLIEKLEGVSFTEALELAATAAGVESSPRSTWAPKPKATTRTVQPREPAQLADRAVTIEGQPASSLLSEFARSRDWNVSTLNQLGCSVVRHPGRPERIRFPFRSETGQLLTWQDRRIDWLDDDPRKWLFPKGSTQYLLYGRQNVTIENVLIVCEGVPDTVALLDIGASARVVGVPGASTFGNPGSAFNDSAAYFNRGAQSYRIVACGDNDDAGRQFNERIGELASGRCDVLAIPDCYGDLADWCQIDRPDFIGSVNEAITAVATEMAA